MEKISIKSFLFFKKRKKIKIKNKNKKINLLNLKKSY